MKVILLKTVATIGRPGEIVEVSDAQARNFLIPKKLAVPATSDILAAHQQRLHQQQVSNDKRQQALQGLMERLTGATIELTGKASPHGKLFAALKTADIQQALEKQFGMSLSGLRSKPDHLKSLGPQSVEVIIDEQHKGMITVDVHG